MASMNEGPADLQRFFFFLIGHLCVIIFTIVMWRWVWLKRIGIELPMDKRDVVEDGLNN